MKILLLFCFLILSFIGNTQVPYRQASRFYEQVTLDKSPWAPYATLPAGLVPLKQMQDTLVGYVKTGGAIANISGGLGGQILYQSSANTTTKLPNGTAGQVLMSQGTTLAPVWGAGSPMVYPNAGIPLSTGTGWGTAIANNSSYWNLAYSWGNHATAGYLTTQISHADVLVDGDFASQGIMLRGAPGTYSILTDNSNNWNSVYSTVNVGAAHWDAAYSHIGTGGNSHLVATTSVAGFESAADKTKLDGIEAGAQTRVNADWDAPSGDTQIINKPSTTLLSNYIAGTNGQTVVMKGDTAVQGVTNGSTGQIWKMLISGNPGWGDGSGATLDSIRVLASAPATGNVYINSTSNKLYIKSGNYWRRPVWASDSIAVSAGTTKTNIATYAFANYNEFRDIGLVNDDGMGTVFQAGASGTLESVKFYLSKVGAPTGTAVARLYAKTGTYGTDAVPTGVALATSDAFSVASLSTSFAEVEIYFTGVNKYSLTSGTQYAILFDWTDGGDASNYVQMGFDNTTPSYAGNLFEVFNGGYYTAAGEDVIFIVYANVNN